MLLQVCRAESAEEVFGAVIMIFTCFGLVVGLIISVLYVIAFCKIFQKAGYSWALGLLMLVPIANFIMPLYLAFAQWPIHKEISELKT